MSSHRTTVVHWVTEYGEQRSYVSDPHGNKTGAQNAYMRGRTEPHRSMPAIILDVTLRPMGVAIWRCYDGPEGDRYTVERVWWLNKNIN